ncbi:hypothetical protein [Lentzea sp. NPDC060358]|uniref:hypothetical protein n=1 Tax=Lentzea sp. NPDC060358 TaxID=3347103 RepID=UPI00364F9599
MPRRPMIALVALLAAACTATPAPAPAPSSPGRPFPRPTVEEEAPAEVVRGVVDGRTVELADGVRARISLLAAPAPCWAAAAREFAETTLLGRPVRFSSIVPGEVTLQLLDGTDYAHLAVRRGVLRAQGAAGALAEAEKTAEQEGLGLWGFPCRGAGSAPATPG